VIFTDDFSDGASPLWNNARGNWTTSSGVYYASAPNNIPATFSGLPFVLQNFSVDVDINGVADGGIWLRSDPAGTNGVLLVTGGNGWGSGSRGANAGRSLYWHVITQANYNNPPILNQAFNVFTNPGAENVHLRIEVDGNVYSAFVNGATTPTTTLVETNRTYASGHVGLYDFSTQTFDNFLLQIPAGFGPYSLNLGATGAGGAVLSWTTNALGWAPETAGSLTSLAWVTVTNQTPVVGTNFVLAIAATNREQYFRLHKE